MAKVLKIEGPFRTTPQGPGTPGGYRFVTRVPLRRPPRGLQLGAATTGFILPRHELDRYRGTGILSGRVREMALTEEGFRSFEKMVKDRLPAKHHGILARTFNVAQRDFACGTGRNGINPAELKTHVDEFVTLFNTYQRVFSAFGETAGFSNEPEMIFYDDLSGFPQVILLRNFVVEAILLILKLEIAWQEKRRKEEAKRQEKESEETRLVERRSEIRRAEQKALERKRLTAA